MDFQQRNIDQKHNEHNNSRNFRRDTIYGHRTHGHEYEYHGSNTRYCAHRNNNGRENEQSTQRHARHEEGLWDHEYELQRKGRYYGNHDVRNV